MAFSFKKTDNTTNPNRATDGKFATKKGTYSPGGAVTGATGIQAAKKLPWKRMAPLIAIVALVGGYLVFKSFATTLPTNNYTSPPLAYTYTDPNRDPYVTSIKTAAADGTNIKSLSTTNAVPDSTAVAFAEYNENSSKLAWYQHDSGGTQTILKIKNMGLQTKSLSGDTSVKQYTLAGLVDSKLKWSADGTKIFYTSLNKSTNKRTLNYVDALTGTTTLFTTISNAPNNTLNIDSWSQMDVLGDGRTVVYNHYSDGILSLTQGQTTPTTVYRSANSCELFGRRPGTQTEFGFVCWENNSNKFYRKTLVGAPQLIYATPISSWSNGANNTYASHPTWSPDGLKLAMFLKYITVLDVATCEHNKWEVIYTINTDGSGLKPLTELSPSYKNIKSCGLTSSESTQADQIAWNVKGSSVAAVSPGIGIKIIDTSSVPYRVYNIPSPAPNLDIGAINLSW